MVGPVPGPRPGWRAEATEDEEEEAEAAAWLRTGREVWRASWLRRLSIDWWGGAAVEKKSWRG